MLLYFAVLMNNFSIMNINARRMRWGIRKQVRRNCKLVTILCCGIFMFLLSCYEECSYLERLPLSSDSNSSQGKMVTVGETLSLNATFLVDDVAFDPDVREVMGVNTIDPTKLKDVLSIPNTHKLKMKLPTKPEESVTELPMDGIFKERKAYAEKACLEMLNTAKIKESMANSINDVKSLNPVFYNKNLFKKRQKHIQVNNHRWVYFHRIVQSLGGPSKNKFVEMKWCRIYKAASSSWLAVFTKLSKALTNHTEAQIREGKVGFLDLARTSGLLAPMIYDKSVHPLEYSMIVVRHPFKRLVSAYRDKIERVEDRFYYYDKYSTKIIARFRSNSSKLPLTEKEFKDKDISLEVPTFKEFVHYVLSTEPSKLDEHWRPMFLHCNICHSPFDFILKVETLNTDKDKIMEYLHVSRSDPLYKEVEDVWARWNNPSGANMPVRNETYYFRQLRLDDIEKLYNLYEPDFKIFNYSPEPYFKMGKDV